MRRFARRCLGWFTLAVGWPLVSAADAEIGRDLAIQHCARCHVIGDYNRLGGIGNTPSFMALTTVADYADRVMGFYSLRPHPVFVRVAGYERWSQAPAYAPEFEITIEEIQHILDYIRTLEGWLPPSQRAAQ